MSHGGHHLSLHSQFALEADLDSGVTQFQAVQSEHTPIASPPQLLIMLLVPVPLSSPLYFAASSTNAR